MAESAGNCRRSSLAVPAMPRKRAVLFCEPPRRMGNSRNLVVFARVCHLIMDTSPGTRFFQLRSCCSTYLRAVKEQAWPARVISMNATDPKQVGHVGERKRKRSEQNSATLRTVRLPIFILKSYVFASRNAPSLFDKRMAIPKGDT